jgi:zinc protease
MPLPNRCRRLLWTLAVFTPLAALALAAPPAGLRGADAPKEKDKDAEAAVLKAADALYDGVRVETLDNGLRVYLKPVPGSPVVTTMVAYKVGSADEDLDATGLSHYLEHLMFKGTEKIKPGDIDHTTYANGGLNNAYTDTDYTIYHFDFPYDRWEAALEIEADRMRNLRIDKAHEFEQEKGAVCNELKRNEDEPWDLEQKAILPLLYGKDDPLGHPVIGQEEHVRAATADVIKKHYDKWYHPNNASLVVVGGFDPDQALAKIKKLFGPIPKADLPERKKVTAAKRKGPVQLDMDSKFPTPRLLFGWNAVRSSHDDFPALSVLEALLNGRTSRLYKKLVEGEEIAVSVAAADNNAGRFPGWFSVQLELVKKEDRDKAEKIVLAELKKLADEPVGDAELKRARRNLMAGSVYGRESVHGLADDLARGVTVNDLDFLKAFLPRLLKVTAADVQRVAKTYLDPDQRVVVWSALPKAAGGAAAPPGGAAKARSAPRAAPTGGGDFPLKDVKRVELPNGLVLLLYEDHRLPIVTASARLTRVGPYEPDDKLGVGTLTGYLLDEGTAKHTGPEIAELIENAGGSLELNSNGGAVRVLAPDRSLGLGLLLESLTQPSFPKEAFQRNKDRLLTGIRESDAEPDAVAQKTFRAAVYGKHPLGRPGSGTVKTVEPLTPDDCAAFHKKVFVPNNTTLAVVGDFDSKEVIEEVKKLTADWKKADLPKLDLPEVTKPKEFTQKVLSMPEAAQLHFFLGHVGVRRDNPDYYKLLVLDYILGTGPGFTYRLSKLRDREGLAYTVTGTIASSADLEPGVFACYIGTDDDKFDRVKKEILEEVNRIRDEKPGAQEVEDAKNYLIGSRALEFTTDAGVASQLLNIERHHLGADYLADFKKAVSAVTPEEVQAVAKKYLDPDHAVLVAAGAVDAKGQPLKKAPPPKP